MPRKKRNSGKAQKAKAKEKQAEVAKKKQESIEAQIAQLKIDSSPMPMSPEESNSSNGDAKKKKCLHGFKLNDAICQRFVKDFVESLMPSIEREEHLADAFKIGSEATAEKFSTSVLINTSRLEKIVASFLYKGTQRYLDGDMTNACLNASIACYFQQNISVLLGNTHYIDTQLIYELHSADPHTLVSYLKRRIPCTCLDTRYKEVKSLPKMGWCCNDKCSLPGRHIERSKMFYCTGCHEACYCSPSCQKGDWSFHKQYCTEFARDKGLL